MKLIAILIVDIMEAAIMGMRAILSEGVLILSPTVSPILGTEFDGGPDRRIVMALVAILIVSLIMIPGSTFGHDNGSTEEKDEKFDYEENEFTVEIHMPRTTLRLFRLLRRGR